MGKIHMEPPQVRDLARRLEQTAGDLYSQSRTLQRAASRLPHIWEGGHSASHQRDFQRYLRSLDRAVDDLQELALRVGREADQWEAADGDSTFAQSGVTARPGDDWWIDWRKELGEGWENWGEFKAGMDLGQTMVVIGGMSAGTTYGGQLIIRGSQSYKDAAGLSEHLTHIKAVNLPKHLIKQNKIKGAEVVGGAIDFGFDAYDDWNQYPDGSEKATALAYDAAWNIGAVLGKVAISNWVAAAVLAPAAAAAIAAGAPVVLVGGAALVAWWGVSYAAGKGFDLVEGFLENSGFKDAVVRAGGRLIDNAAETAVDLARGAEEALNVAVDGISSGARSAAKAVDNAFDSVVSGISSWF